jgi:hypothetical protein
MQSMDEAKIYKQKLALLGDCFKTIVRKVRYVEIFLILLFYQAPEMNERWANTTTHLNEQIVDLSEDVDRLRTLDERFEQSTKALTNLQGQHEDLLVQFRSLKSIVGKVHLYLREYKRKWSQVSDDNLHLRIENKRLRDKIDDFYRTEGLMHTNKSIFDNLSVCFLFFLP